MKALRHSDGTIVFVNDDQAVSYEAPDWTFVGDVADGARTEFLKVEDDQIVENLQLVQDMKWAEIKMARDLSRYSGCMTPLGRMDTSEESRNLLTSAAGLAVIVGPSFAVDWTMEDNSVVTHDAGAICGAGVAVGIWYAGRQSIGTDLRNQIYAAATIAEVEAVAWPG